MGVDVAVNVLVKNNLLNIYIEENLKCTKIEISKMSLEYLATEIYLLYHCLFTFKLAIIKVTNQKKEIY